MPVVTWNLKKKRKEGGTVYRSLSALYEGAGMKRIQSQAAILNLISVT
jgi:hypothetical protein